jgi:hypothetical protein
MLPPVPALAVIVTDWFCAKVAEIVCGAVTLLNV